MNKFTLKCLSGDPWGCCLTIIKRQFKSITGLAVLMLFLFNANTMQAQVPPVVPCINGDSFEWGSPQFQGQPTFLKVNDTFEGNMDDIYTGSKDFKLFGPNNNDSAYNEWTLSPMQAKSDIMNAAAVIMTNIEGIPTN